MAVTARMPTAITTIGMTISTSLATVGFTFNFNGIFDINNAKTIGASTFHLGNSVGSHSFQCSSLVFKVLFEIFRAIAIKYDAINIQYNT